MAEWVSHLIVADRVLERLPWLMRHEFCVGNIAPDCNLPNEDWSDWVPSRQVTHWMSAARKTASDSSRFCEEYILGRRDKIKSKEELSFLLGYYSHLITDAEMQRMTRDEKRVAAAWERIKKLPEIMELAAGMEENWDNVKKLMPPERQKDFHVIEREYLDQHPNSGYFTEIKDLTEFPDYIDYLPKGAIPLKAKYMYYMPEVEERKYPFVMITRDEYAEYLDRSVALVVKALQKTKDEMLKILQSKD